LEYFIALFWLSLASILILKSKFYTLPNIPSNHVRIAFLIKLISGLFIWILYTYYYKNHSVNDIYKYYEDGKLMLQIFKTNPSDFFQIIRGNQPISPKSLHLLNNMKFWVKPNSYGIYNDNQTIILISSILCLLSWNNILNANLLISFIAFTSLILTFKIVSPYLSNFKKLFFCFLFLSPSIACWTSGLLKETIILISLTLCIYFGIKLIEQFKKSTFIYLFASCFLLLISKTYLLGFLLPSLGCVIVLKLFSIQKVRTSFLLLYTILITIFITWCLTHNPVIYNYKNKTKAEINQEYSKINQLSYDQNVLGNNYNLLEMFRFKQADYIFEAKLEHANSLIATKKMDGRLSNFFACLPYGLSNGFSRPHIFEIKSILMVLPAIENFVILSLLLLSLLFTTKLSYNQKILVYGFGTFVTLTFVFLGLLVPVLGNLVRYKSPLLPILYFLLFLLIDKNKLQNFWYKIRHNRLRIFNK
jgi:hypothetical protein